MFPYFNYLRLYFRENYQVGFRNHLISLANLQTNFRNPCIPITGINTRITDASVRSAQHPADPGLSIFRRFSWYLEEAGATEAV
jgi:hypothetical protein